MRTAAPFDARNIAQAWEQALRLWGVNVSLSAPSAWSPDSPRSGKGMVEAGDPIAYIDMNARQVVVNFPMLDHIGARQSLTAVLAHEVGHHIAFPHTLGLAAQLEVLEGQLLPRLQDSLLNLFFDLQVNEVVGRTLAPELCTVYRGHQQAFPPDKLSPLFNFYLACYEELWGLAAGSLTPSSHEDAMEQQFAGWRGEARMFVQTFYSLPNVYLQFVYFCGVFIRYLPASGKVGAMPLSGDLPQPDLDDYAGALYGSPAVDEALQEAKKRGMLPEGAGEAPSNGADPLSKIDRLTRNMPGTTAAPFRRALVGRHYKRLVEQYLIKVPGIKAPPPEPMLPTTTEEWEFGDNPKLIDWNQSVLARGALAAVSPLRREYEAEDPRERGQVVPGIEIYLDTSGSMPNPQAGLNVMTLAAQILAAAALRKGGKVRAVIYSYGNPLVSDWMQSEDVALDFLLNYAGGGTLFPFDVLKRFAARREEVIRVVISDSDFLSNVAMKDAMPIFERGIEHSTLTVGLFAGWYGGEKQFREALKTPLSHANFRMVLVGDLRGFGKAAADLSDALFGR